jgi:hypothetical protein
LGENQFKQTQIEFGNNILGREPETNSEVTIYYIATEESHANGLSSLSLASSIENYSNVVISVTTPAYGGSDRETMESIKFNAPKYYQSQDRALTDTDYIPLIQKQFPFVKSAISWGGETNIPPTYGTVFVSIISDQGIVTNAVKQQMVAYLKDKNVGSITPTIVDPNNFYTNLSIKFSYDKRITILSYNGFVTRIKEIIDEYNNDISSFDLFFNSSELISRIKDVQGIISVDISNVVYKNIVKLNFLNPVYSTSFYNKIEEGSVNANGFSVALNSTNTRLYDKDGIVYLTYTKEDNTTVIREVGTVNYETGNVEFVINIIDDINEFSLFVTPVEDNFYVQQNQVISIDKVDVNLIEIRNRD